MLTKKYIAVVVGIVLTPAFLFFGTISYLKTTAWDGDIFERAMRIQQGDRVADVGSGRGKYSLHMAQAVGDTGRVFAVDVDNGALQHLQKSLQDRETTNVTTVLSLHDDPMLPDRFFDALLVRNAYHEFQAPERMLRYMGNALKSDGRLILAEYIDEDLLGTTRATQVDEHTLAMHHARDELEDAGFEIVEIVNNVHETRSDTYDLRLPVIGYRLWMQQAGHRMWMIVARPPSRSRTS